MIEVQSRARNTKKWRCPQKKYFLACILRLNPSRAESEDVSIWIFFLFESIERRNTQRKEKEKTRRHKRGGEKRFLWRCRPMQFAIQILTPFFLNSC